MRRIFRMLVSGLLWGFAGCLTVVELILAGGWLRGTLYVRQYGAAENPYAAEEAEIMGCCALLLLPLLLAVLALTVYWTIGCKKRTKVRSER